jgi:hypothetical protein
MTNSTPNRGLIEFRSSAFVELEGLPILEEHHFLTFQRDELLHWRKDCKCGWGEGPEKEKKCQGHGCLAECGDFGTMVVQPKLTL